MNITAFACNHQVAETSVASDLIQMPEPARAAQSQASERLSQEQLERNTQATVPPGGNTPVSLLLMPDPASVQDSRDPSSIDEVSQDHGRHKSLIPENKRVVLRLHKNLGHPDPLKLSKVLQQRGYSQETCQGVLDLKCSICQMQQRPRLQDQPPSKKNWSLGIKFP